MSTSIVKRDCLASLNFHLDDLAVKAYKPISGEWDLVTVVGEIPQYKVLLTFHTHHLNINLVSKLTEWSTIDLSIKKEFEMQGLCRAVHIIYSDSPSLMVAKRKEVELYRYVPSETLQLLKKIRFEHFIDEAAYFEVQKLSLEAFGIFGVAAYARGLNKYLERIYEAIIYDLKSNRYVRKLEIKQESSMVVPLVLEKKKLIAVGTGSFVNFLKISNLRVIKRLKVPSDNEAVFDVRYLETRDVIIVYVKSEEDMSAGPKLFFWKADGLKFIQGPIKWISHNIAKNFHTFDGFDFYFSLASQTKVVFQNIRGYRKEKELELPPKSSGWSFYKILGKNRIICVCRNQTRFYFVLVTY